MTLLSTIIAVRRILDDTPDRIQLDGAIANGTTPSIVVESRDFGKVGIGNILEVDEVDAFEPMRVLATDPTTNTLTVERNYMGYDTAVAHLDGYYLLKDPRFFTHKITHAINTVLETDLYNKGVVDLNEHQITSSSTTLAYNAPTSSCQEFLAVAQKTASMTEPLWLTGGDFSRLPQNIDTSLYANGKVFLIYRNYGIGGSDIYYVTCAHKHTISTITGRSQRIVEWLACAYLLEWTEPRRTAGPTNQGDRTVRPGQGIATSSYFRELAKTAIAEERSEMRRLNPPQKIFRRA